MSKSARSVACLLIGFCTAHCAVGLIDTSATEGGASNADAADEQAVSQDDAGTTSNDAAVSDASTMIDSASPDSATGACPPNWAAPTTVAGCHCGSTHTCTANGCYGGYWCDTTGDTCHATPPAGCM